MQQEIQQMLFKLKLQKISAKKIEEDLGFSNGVLAKAAKGIVGISPARFELFKQYYDVNVIDDRTNPLINAARGRDESGVNNDEFKTAWDVQIEDLPNFEEYAKRAYDMKQDPIITSEERQAFAKEIENIGGFTDKQKSDIVKILKS